MVEGLTSYMGGPAVMRTRELLINHFLAWLIVGLVVMTAVMWGMAEEAAQSTALCAGVGDCPVWLDR